MDASGSCAPQQTSLITKVCGGDFPGQSCTRGDALHEQRFVNKASGHTKLLNLPKTLNPRICLICVFLHGFFVPFSVTIYVHIHLSMCPHVNPPSCPSPPLRGSRDQSRQRAMLGHGATRQKAPCGKTFRATKPQLRKEKKLLTWAIISSMFVHACFWIG